MGNAKRRKQVFFETNPLCIFCGGVAKAETIEHCPPRSLFQFRAWPEGFEFAACLSCNAGSADDDALVAMLARMDPITNAGDLDGRTAGLIKNVNAQYPRMIKKMLPTAVEARRKNRELGISPPSGMIHQDTGAVWVTDEMDTAVKVLAGKLAKAIYFLDSGSIFPSDGPLIMRWFTNADLFRTGSYGVFDALKALDGSAPQLTRTGKYLNDQFEYKYSPTPERDVFALQVRFGNSFGLVVFGATQVGRLEETKERIREAVGSDTSLGILQ